MPVLDTARLIENRVQAIRNLHYESGQHRAELDLSGGVDSAVMLGLLARALGPENVTAIFLDINSNPDALKRAREVAETFDVSLIEFDGTQLFNLLTETMTTAMVLAGYDPHVIANRVKTDPTIMGSIRSTLRAPWGRAANRLSGGGIRHGTGNEDEDRILRFYQKGGDGEVDSNPISMLSKGETFQLARALDVPRSILTARPSPDLWGTGDQHNDEDEIASYLGLSGRGQVFYSYVSPDTGEYTSVGLIERLSRFCDCFMPRQSGDAWVEVHKWLFDDELGATGLDKVVEAAKNSLMFKGIDPKIVDTLLTNARRVERNTRHKLNPNCPALGSRAELLREKILTDVLPL